MPPALDGSAVDIWTICIAVGAMFIRPVKRLFSYTRPCFTYRDCVTDFLNGSTLVPFLLLVGSVMSSALLEEALRTNKMFMALAGVIGVLFGLRELISAK